MILVCSAFLFFLASMKSNDFSFCDPEIASILAAPVSAENDIHSHIILNETAMSIQFPASSSMNDLVTLALESDDYVFRSKQHGTHCQDLFMNELVAFCSSSNESSAATTATALLALNALESSIRYSTGFTCGRAPLLKKMVERISDEHIRRACQLLLLHQGLNLRNLVWHGFVPQLPRPWLALVLVLNSALQQGKSNIPKNTTVPEVMDLRSVPGFKSVFDYDINMQESSRIVQAWIPESHHDLWNLAVKWHTERVRPVSTIALLSILLEHGLRLEWCRYNNRPGDAIARPGEFYVTLDGHGQRHVHDILLHPYMMKDGSRNHLIENLPGSTTAILTDLFCSSCGGPNIRSTVSHGMWDSFLENEWDSANHRDQKTPLLWDTAEAMLVAMVLIASKKAIPYLPVFSYAAVTRQNFLQAQSALQKLEQKQLSADYVKYLAMATTEFGELSDYVCRLKVTISVKPTFLNGTNPQPIWSAVNVFEEHEFNKRLAGAGAVRSLLQDVASATESHMEYLQDALVYLASPNEKPNKRKHKRSLRIIHSSQVAITSYNFFMQVAAIYLQQEMGDDEQLEPSMILKAVERSRMVVSTVDSFLHSSTDRAMKSIMEYTKGRAIKAIITLENTQTLVE